MHRYDEDLASSPWVESSWLRWSLRRETDALWFDTCSARDNQHCSGCSRPACMATVCSVCLQPKNRRPLIEVSRRLPSLTRAPGISPVVVARRRKQTFEANPRPTPECRAFVALKRARRVRDRLDDISQPASTSAGSSSPAKSHITVRSFPSTWNTGRGRFPRSVAQAMMRWPPCGPPCSRGDRTPAIRRSWHGGGLVQQLK